MPPLGPLPRGPALVLAAALGAPVVQATEPPAEVEQTLVSVRFEVEGTGDSRDSALADARAKAVTLAFEQLELPYGVAQHVLPRHTPTEWLQAKPALFPFTEEDPILETGNAVTVRMALSLDGQAMEALRKAFSVVGPSMVGDVAVDPMGEVICIRSPHHRIAGARLVRTDRQPIDDLDDAKGIAKSTWLEYTWGGELQRLQLAIPVERPPRELAPTCGPCCHGHCDDDKDIYGLGGGLGDL